MLAGRLFPRGKAGPELQSGGLALVGADGMELRELWAQEALRSVRIWEIGKTCCLFLIKSRFWLVETPPS